MGFGSGVVPEGTGIVLQNRGSYFTLDRKHHNSLKPNKRTFHTLCASLGLRDDRTLFALGTMGGDIQPQVQVQLMTKILDLGIDPQAAIDAPRWIIPATIYETPSSIDFEKGSEPSSRLPRELKSKILPGLSSVAGHAQAVFLGENNLLGAADARGEGSVKGF